jgi:hypothetical protein
MVVLLLRIKTSWSARSAFANANKLIKQNLQGNHHRNGQTFQILLGQLQENNQRLTGNDRCRMRSGDVYMLKRIPWYIREGKLVQVMFWKLLQFPSFSDGNCQNRDSCITFFRNFSAEIFFSTESLFFSTIFTLHFLANYCISPTRTQKHTIATIKSRWFSYLLFY